MLGVIVVLIVSSILLWVISKEYITVLGITPNRQRLKEFSAGFLFSAVVCTVNQLGQSYFKDITYSSNPDYGLMDGLMGTWWTVKAVLFEEFIYRGVILYLLIKKIGIVRACLLGALVFGIYHWFSYGMLGGRIVPMIYILLLTGAGGWMFAYAFAKTKSLFAPIGLHLGWILVSIVVFSDGPLGSQWLLPSSGAVELGGWAQLMFFLFQVLVVPGIVTWYLHYRYLANGDQEEGV